MNVGQENFIMNIGQVSKKKYMKIGQNPRSVKCNFNWCFQKLRL